MNNSLIEEKRNKLNLDIRGILAVIDLIDDKEKEYEDYITNYLDENGFLDQISRGSKRKVNQYFQGLKTILWKTIE